MIDEAERVSRREAADAAIASARIEGVIPDPEILALVEDYIAGELDADGLMQHALAIWGPNEKSPPGGPAGGLGARVAERDQRGRGE